MVICLKKNMQTYLICSSCDLFILILALTWPPSCELLYSMYVDPGHGFTHCLLPLYIFLTCQQIKKMSTFKPQLLIPVSFRYPIMHSVKSAFQYRALASIV